MMRGHVRSAIIACASLIAVLIGVSGIGAFFDIEYTLLHILVGEGCARSQLHKVSANPVIIRPAVGDI
jgi:hypothetical protein